MKEKEIKLCQELLKVFNEMYFKELKGSELQDKFFVFHEFAKMVMSYQSPKEIKPTIKKDKK